MLVENRKIKDLLPAKYNPRKALKPGDPEYEKLKNSITEFGLVAPVIWNKTTGCLVGGHQRLTVLKDLGYTEVPCVVVELDITHEKALNIALNKISGAWDFEKLRGVFDALKLEGFDQALTGFGEVEIENLFKSVLEDAVHDDDFDVTEELEKPAFSSPGDLWLLGKHRLFCGDSTKPDYLQVLMNGKKANLVLTDPPYNVNYHGSRMNDGTMNVKQKIKNDNMSDSDFYHFLLDAFSMAYAASASDASIYIFHAEAEGMNFRKAMVDAKWVYNACCVWNKNALVLSRTPYQPKHEPCLFGWKKKLKWFADAGQPSIWDVPKPVRNDAHPTMKPIPLLVYPIKNSTATNCIVLDPFGGSGSTLIACEQTGRICFTVELDEKFCDVIINRYIAQVGGDTSKVRVVRGGQELSYEEVAAGGA